MRDYRGRGVTLLAPLVVARKGFYTDLAKWAAKKGYRELGVDIPTARWPRLNRFKEHTIELPVATLSLSAKNDFELNQALAKALDYGKGLVSVLPAGENPQSAIFSTRRACPSCGRSFAELDPRMFSFNSKHGWCTSCFGTGLEIPEFDDAQTGEEIWWNEWFEQEAVACTACQGQRLNPVALNIRFRKQSIANLAAGSIEATIDFFTGPEAIDPRAGDRSRPAGGDSCAPEIPGAGRAWLSAIGPRRAHSFGPARRSAYAWPRSWARTYRACAMFWMSPRSDCIRATTRCCWTRWRNWPRIATPWSSSNMTRTPFGAPIMCWIWVPGAGVRGGEVVGRGTVADLMANESSVTGRFLRQTAAASRQALAHGECRFAQAHSQRRQAPQCEGRGLRHSAGLPGGGDRSVRIGQINGGPRCALHQSETPGRRRSPGGTCASRTQRRREAGGKQENPAARFTGRLQGHPGRRTDTAGTGSRPDAYRQDPALLPRDLRGILG